MALIQKIYIYIYLQYIITYFPSNYILNLNFLFGFCYSEKNIPEVKFDSMRYKPLLKLIVRLMKEFKIPQSTCCNALGTKHRGSLRFLCDTYFIDQSCSEFFFFFFQKENKNKHKMQCSLCYYSSRSFSRGQHYSIMSINILEFLLNLPFFLCS